MKGRRVAGFLAVSTAAIVLGALLWGKFVSAQDAPQFQNAAATDSPLTAPSFEAPPQNAGQPPALSPESGDNATEVLTRGAVHEAFAQPVVFNPVPSTVVPKQPPDPVEEMPPEQKPAGDHVSWIPGYWSYEADQQKYIWTSGIWRAVPAGQEWVPGYWTPADGGHQWVSGFWRKGDVTEVTYLPQKPPETLEAGPSGTPPNPDYVWIPGCWIWRGSRYIWRGGYWAACNPDWIWIPSHYVWTPSGYVFAEGHWDYSMERRGLIFAPVVFRPGVYVGPGYVYTPAIAMDFGVCTGCLFCRPGFHCYCFGDYYAADYAAIGIYPWFAFHGRYGYDPCFAYYRWHYRGDPRWHERLVSDYRFRIGHLEARPARTFVAMRLGGGGGLTLAVHINVMAARGGAHFERVSAVRRAEIHRAVREQRVANERRVAMERANAGRGGGGPMKMSIPKSSVGTNANAGRAQNNAQHGATSHPVQQQRNTRPAQKFAPRSTGRAKPETR